MKKRILIVGMLADQERRIEQEYKHRFDLRFMDSTRMHRHLESAALAADVVIVNTKFVSHCHCSRVRKGQVINFRGGASSLKKVIEEL